MKLRPVTVLAAAAASFGLTESNACADGLWLACPGQQTPAPYAHDELIPGVSWDAWRALLRRDWNDAERRRAGWFEANALIAAATAAPLVGEYNIDHAHAGGYVPPVPGTDAQADAYAAAQTTYHAGEWTDAASAFETIAAQTSPYRAAAAYSAARATLNRGDFEGGISRIGAILADPADAEMHQAAHHLLGTLAAQTNAAPLLAARLEEISHLLMAPPSLRCTDLALASLAKEADADFAFIISFAYGTNRFSYGPTWSPERRAIFAKVGRLDPVIDLAATLAEPGRFGNAPWIEPFYPQAVHFPGYELGDQTILYAYRDEAAAATKHARLKARTGNPLWAYALASRTTDVADLPEIDAAIAASRSGDDLPTDRRILAGWLAANELRILLMAGREDEALAALSRLGPVINGDTGTQPGLRQFVYNGGIRFLLARRDFDGAKRWAAATRVLARVISIAPDDLTMDLAPNWEEALRWGTGVSQASNLPDGLAAALDLQPADRLVQLARLPGLATSWRRPILGAAWIRYYMLGRDADFRDLFPDIRAAFPETVADLDEIDHAWTPWTRRRLITRMLLRLPGLSPRVLWVRGDFIRARMFGAAPSGMFGIDSYNPNDGNWWCPVNPARARLDAFAALFSDLARDWYLDLSNFSTLEARVPLPDGAPTDDALSASWLAWYPLTKDANYAELDRLAKAGSGPFRLTSDAVGWAANSNVLTRWLGFDRYLPETLALAVRSTRYGCRMAEPLGPTSRSAWEALHKLFPQSEWARRTRWWFDENPPKQP
jgi:hypothetical protein